MKPLILALLLLGAICFADAHPPIPTPPIAAQPVSSLLVACAQVDYLNRPTRCAR